MKTITLLFLVIINIGFALSQGTPSRDLEKGGAIPSEVIEGDSAEFRMATLFTPNGDGLNDVYQVYSINVDAIEYFLVYNKRGNIVYKAQGSKDIWDGNTDGGKELPIGVYAYRIKATNGQSEWTGSIKLMK